MTFGRKTGEHVPGGIDLYGLWGGVVEDNKDPEKRGRVRVRIFDFHDDNTPIDELPWALPCFPSAFSKHTNGRMPADERKNGGFFHVPPEDSLVHVMFRQGDTDRPVWLGGWFPVAECIHGRETYFGKQPRRVLYNGEGVPSCPTWSSIRGFHIELDDEIAEIRITTPKGHKITASDDAGNEHYDCIKLEDHKGNYFWMDTGNDLLKLYWNGDVEEHVTGNWHTTIDGNKSTKVLGNVSEDYVGNLDTKQGGARRVDAAGKIFHNCGNSAPEPPNKPDKGEKSSGDHVRSALRRLGNQIRKIITGS